MNETTRAWPKRKWNVNKRDARPLARRDMADPPDDPNGWVDEDLVRWARYHAGKVMRRYGRRPGCAGDEDDVAQELLIQMMRARKLYDPSRGIRFTTYFGRFMRIHAHRSASTMCRESGFTMVRSDSDPIDSKSVPKKRTVSIQDPIPSMEDGSGIDLEDRSARPDEIVASRDIKDGVIERALSSLDPRTRQVVELRVLLGLTLEEVSKIVSVGRERVRQIQKRGLELLRVSLTVGNSKTSVMAG